MGKIRILNHLLSVLVVIAFLILAIGSDDTGSVTTDLNAQVSFDGKQFTIINNNNFDYINAKLELNDKYILRGYDIKAGQTYTVGMMQFADKDGNRFTMMQKPQSFTILCDLSSGKRGFYYAEWQ